MIFTGRATNRPNSLPFVLIRAHYIFISDGADYTRSYSHPSPTRPKFPGSHRHDTAHVVKYRCAQRKDSGGEQTAGLHKPRQVQTHAYMNILLANRVGRLHSRACIGTYPNLAGKHSCACYLYSNGVSRITYPILKLHYIFYTPPSNNEQK